MTLLLWRLKHFGLEIDLYSMFDAPRLAKYEAGHAARPIALG